MTAFGFEVPALVVPPPSMPLAVARVFLDDARKGDGDLPLLRSHRATFYAWSGTCWPELEERALRSELYRWLEYAVWETSTGDDAEFVPWARTKAKIGNVIDALGAATYLPASVASPPWRPLGSDRRVRWAAKPLRDSEHIYPRSRRRGRGGLRRTDQRCSRVTLWSVPRSVPRGRKRAFSRGLRILSGALLG